MDGAFTVTPMSNAIELKPGDVYEGDILVSNPQDSKSDFDYKVEIMPYGVIGNNYDADFASLTQNTEIVNWISVKNPTGTIAPNGKVHIEYTITVPIDAPGGGQYAAIQIGKDIKEEMTESFGVQNVYSIASLIYAKIDGEIIRDGEIIQNSFPGFVTGLPANTEVMLKNGGNSHEPANIYLKIKNVLTGEVVYPKNGESGGINEEIMPGTTRFFQKSIQDISPLGVYEVTQTVKYLGESNVSSHLMFVCPIWFMLLVFVTVCSIIALIVSRILKRKKGKLVV